MIVSPSLNSASGSSNTIAVFETCLLFCLLDSVLSSLFFLDFSADFSDLATAPIATASDKLTSCFCTLSFFSFRSGFPGSFDFSGLAFVAANGAGFLAGFGAGFGGPPVAPLAGAFGLLSRLASGRASVLLGLSHPRGLILLTGIFSTSSTSSSRGELLSE